MGIKIGDFVKLKDWDVFLEVLAVDYDTNSIKIAQRTTDEIYIAWYNISQGFIKQEEDKMEKQDEFQVGDVVYCAAYGKGKVHQIDSDSYCIGVEYVGIGTVFYTEDGRLTTGGPRCLFFSEPKVEGALTRPFVSTLVGKTVVVREYGCYPQLFTVGWENEKMLGSDICSCTKANCEVYEVSSENLLKK